MHDESDARPNMDSIQTALRWASTTLPPAALANLERTAMHVVRREATLAQAHAILRTVSAAQMALRAQGASAHDLLAAHLGLPASLPALRAETLRVLAGEMLQATTPGHAISQRLITDLYLRRVKNRRSLAAVPMQRGEHRTNSEIAGLVSFCNRDDLPVMQQAIGVALAAGTWSGDGQVLGPALFQVVLRRRGTTTTWMPPVPDLSPAPTTDASDRGDYWAGVMSALRINVTELENACIAVSKLPDVWRERVRPRRGSAASRLLGILSHRPVVTAHRATDATGASVAAVYGALSQLEASGVLVEVSGQRRNRVWYAPEVVDAVDRRMRTR